MSPAILKTFYSVAIESVLTQCISVWYSNATNQDCKALQRVKRLAERISGSSLPSLQDICHESGCHSPHLLHNTTAAHHPWTAFPIHHCTNHTAVTNHSFALIVSPHLHLIHTHTHISSTLPCTHCEVLFSPV